MSCRWAGSQQKDQSRYSDLRHFDVSKRTVPVVLGLFRRLSFAVSMGAGSISVLCYTVHLSYARFVPYPFSKGISFLICQWKTESCSVVSNSATPWTVVPQAPLSIEFSRQEYWSGSHSLLQGIFPTQRSNPNLLHCRQILYCLSNQRSPYVN